MSAPWHSNKVNLAHSFRIRSYAMPLPLTPRGIKIVLEATQNTTPVVNVWNVQAPATVTLTDLNDVSTVMDAWIISDLLPLMHSSWHAQQLIVTDLSSATPSQVITPLGVGYEGQVGGDPTAANAAVCVSWRTAVIGRSYRGRTFLGGLPNVYLASAQNINTANAVGIAAAAANLISVLTTAGYILSVLSYYSNLVLRVSGLLTEIVSVIVDTKVDSQRRRTAN